jgi:L-malate glycosyltransferase
MISVLFMHKGGRLIRGSEQSLLLLLKNLDRKRIKPVVLCNRDEFAEKVHELGIDCRTMPWPEMTVDSEIRFEPFRFLKALAFTRGIIRKEKIDLLYANGGLPCQMGVVLSKLFGPRTICHIRSPHPRRYAWMWLFKFADTVIFVSDEVRKSMAAKVKFRHRTCVIYNAVDTDKFKRERKPNTVIRDRLSIGRNDVVIGQVGSLIHRKGVDLLLRAFAELSRDRRNIKLVIVGDGEKSYEGYLESLAAELNILDHLIFAGETSTPELFYSEVFDINVLSSRMEALPRTLIEAAACGLPNVASNSDGIPEIIDDGVTGLLFEKENYLDLKEKLAILIDDKALRSALGEQGRNRVKSMFNVENYVASVQKEIIDTATSGKDQSSGLELLRRGIQDIVTTLKMPVLTTRRNRWRFSSGRF